MCRNLNTYNIANKVIHVSREKLLSDSFYNRSVGHSTATVFVQCLDNLRGLWAIFAL